MSIQPGSGYTFSASSSGTCLNVQQPWGDWEGGGGESAAPFTIINQSVGTTYKFSAVPGAVNSLIPQIGTTADPTKRLDLYPPPTTDFVFDATTGYSFIYLQVSSDNTGTPSVFPVSTDTNVLYPRVISIGTQQTATNDSAYFLLAVAYQDPAATPPKPIRLTQIATGSQWSDRIKTGSATARYYFALA